VPIPWEIIVGAGGGFAFAIWVVDQLWKAHKDADQRERERTAAAEAELRALVAELRNALRKGTPK
jgi:hypothetical protein